MTTGTIKYQTDLAAFGQREVAFRGLFYNSPNLLNRDTYPSAKVNKIIEN